MLKQTAFYEGDKIVLYVSYSLLMLIEYNSKK